MKKLIDNLPFWLFYLTVFLLPFVNFPNLRKFGYPIQLTDFIFLLTVLIYGVYLLLGKAKVRWSWFYLPLTIYFVSLCLSTYFSENQRTSLIKLAGEAYLIGLAKLAFNLVDDESKFRKIGMAWLSATFLVCFVSFASLILFYIQRYNPILLFTLSHYGSLPTGNYARIQSTFFNPNMLCNYLNISAVFLLLASKFDWLKKEVVWIFSILFAVAVFFTVSPGIGGILLTIGLWFGLDGKSTKPLLSRFSLVSGMLGAILFFLTTLVSPTNFPNEIHFSARILTWSSALETLQKNPILGRGIGINAAEVSYLAPNGVQQLGDAHQLWLNVAGQQGLIGLFAIIFLTIWFLRQSLPLNFGNSRVSIYKTAFGIAFIGAFCYHGLSGSFEDARHLWVLIGLLGSVNEIKNE